MSHRPVQLLLQIYLSSAVSPPCAHSNLNVYSFTGMHDVNGAIAIAIAIAGTLR